jgi:uncharacterized protein YggU (UPF0235/DUF167 family)
MKIVVAGDKKWVIHHIDEPPVKGGQNEALLRTYSEMV